MELLGIGNLETTRWRVELVFVCNFIIDDMGRSLTRRVDRHYNEVARCMNEADVG